MKKLLMILILLGLTESAQAVGIQGMHCGTRGNLWGTIASDFLIPDYFPPENALIRMIFNPFYDLDMCEESFPSVNLGQSCMAHDQCYSTRGADKDQCDDTLLEGWSGSCFQNYPQDGASGSYCLSTCLFAINLMNTALRYDDGSFCPSCVAFENSQRNPHRGR